MSVTIQMIFERIERVKKRLTKNDRAIISREAYMKKFAKMLENAQGNLDIKVKQKKEIEEILFPLMEKYKVILKEEELVKKHRNQMRGGINGGQKDLDRLYNNKKLNTQYLQDFQNLKVS